MREKNPFFYLLFGYLMTNFEPFSRGQPQLPHVNHCIFQPKGHREPGNEVSSLSQVEHLVGFELGTF